MSAKNLTEEDLYLPVKKMFEDEGYTVKGEVNHCDLVAQAKDKPLVLVELKKNLNLELMLQGVDRLTITDQVYFAFPLPKTTQRQPLESQKSQYPSTLPTYWCRHYRRSCQSGENALGRNCSRPWSIRPQEKFPQDPRS